jgi:hypothetical protein
MNNSPANSTDFRFLLPEIIWLEPEHFEQAKEISDLVNGEALQWQTHLNALALLGFEKWLNDRIPEQAVYRDATGIVNVCYLKFGEFKLCLIASEGLLDEVINVPQDAIASPELAAHFYVVLEVLEEQGQVIIKGFLRYDQVVNYRSRDNLQLLRDGCYKLPLSALDTEPNHLLFYCRFLEPTAIPLCGSAERSAMPSLRYLKETRTKLSQWLQGVFNEGWLAIDALVNPQANLALSTRNIQVSVKGGKLIDLGMQLGSQTAALLVDVTEETENKLGVLVQLHPTGREKYLPPNLKLTLLSKAGKKLQEVQSRGQDNYIQLQSFKGEPGKRFSIEVTLSDTRLREYFEL